MLEIKNSCIIPIWGWGWGVYKSTTEPLSKTLTLYFILIAYIILIDNEEKFYIDHECENNSTVGTCASLVCSGGARTLLNVVVMMQIIITTFILWYQRLYFENWHGKYFCMSVFKVQSNLCTTTTLGTQNLWPLLTGGRCLEVILCSKKGKRDPEMVVVVGRWSLFGGGR